MLHLRPFSLRNVNVPGVHYFISITFFFTNSRLWGRPNPAVVKTTAKNRCLTPTIQLFFPGPPGAASTPNLPTTTPVHKPPILSHHQAPIVSETSLSSSSNLLNGSSNQLSKAEEKIQGRGMCRSNASYGIQQLLQEQVNQVLIIIIIESILICEIGSGSTAPLRFEQQAFGLHSTLDD